jgi:hypothetical protein
LFALVSNGVLVMECRVVAGFVSVRRTAAFLFNFLAVDFWVWSR